MKTTPWQRLLEDRLCTRCQRPQLQTILWSHQPGTKSLIWTSTPRSKLLTSRPFPNSSLSWARSNNWSQLTSMMRSLKSLASILETRALSTNSESMSQSRRLMKAPIRKAQTKLIWRPSTLAEETVPHPTRLLQSPIRSSSQDRNKSSSETLLRSSGTIMIPMAVESSTRSKQQTSSTKSCKLKAKDLQVWNNSSTFSKSTTSTKTASSKRVRWLDSSKDS